MCMMVCKPSSPVRSQRILLPQFGLHVKPIIQNAGIFSAVSVLMTASLSGLIYLLLNSQYVN